MAITQCIEPAAAGMSPKRAETQNDACLPSPTPVECPSDALSVAPLGLDVAAPFDKTATDEIASRSSDADDENLSSPRHGTRYLAAAYGNHGTRLRVEGRWLEDAGFTSGSTARITVYDRCLVIEIVPEVERITHALAAPYVSPGRRRDLIKRLVDLGYVNG